MRKIDKKLENILSSKYRSWINKLEAGGKDHPANYRYYYDDIAMSLYKCQNGICAYTEMFICIPEIYSDVNWVKGRFITPKISDYKRSDHFGEMDHFDPTLKGSRYWRWNNLFMIHSSVNSLKRDLPVVYYLRPDLENYSPEKYFDYDETTHRFVPNVDIIDDTTRSDIQRMIDEVFYLNHGVVRRERRDYINMLKHKIKNGSPYQVDRFFTAANFCGIGYP